MTDEAIKVGDVVQIDPKVSPYAEFSVVVGFDGDVAILKDANSRPRHYVHLNWCHRIGRAKWNPEAILEEAGITPRNPWNPTP